MHYPFIILLLLSFAMEQIDVLTEASLMMEFSKEQLFLLKRRGLSKPSSLSELPVTRLLPFTGNTTSLPENQMLMLSSCKLHQKLNEDNITCNNGERNHELDGRVTEIQSMCLMNEQVMKELTIIETMPFNPDWLFSSIIGFTELVYNIKCELRGMNDTLLCLPN
ncbi:unnamed protein product [Phytomonas sp. EM1]|nr:unnamed protein product [Phytomonas sp. EM1]|eukprot:CCW65673.1 unnamed protein product [Phytomonas sp. isolate EM1]